MKASKRNQIKQPFDFLQKVIIIGDSGVGKSNILLRYSQNKFVENHMMTIGINYVFKVIEVDKIRIKLQIWDTAGQDKYKTITQNYYKNSNGVFIVFGLDSRDSFQSVTNWIEDLVDSVTDSTQVILVGNKSDITNNRQVSREQAQHLAQRSGFPYVQCSAKTGEGVESSFFLLAQMMKKHVIDGQKKEEPTKMEINVIPKKKCCQQ